MSRYSRRRLLHSSAGLVVLPTLMRSFPAAAQAGLTLGPAQPFTFESLIDRARAMSKQDYVPPPRPDASIVQQIDYDAYGKIKYKPEAALFATEGAYPITFMHVGNFFPKTVRMHELKDGMAQEVVYSPDYFDMPADHVAKGLGPEPSAFAGFWVRETNRKGDWTKVEPFATFLGASYYRALGPGGQIGMSARGVALSPAGAEAEEFPDFTEYWFERAAEEGDPTTVYALLDGPSITGAFKFQIRRTEGTVMDIENHLFLRKEVARLGIAPLTSMFWYGEANRPREVDWRPEVHDSDGLSLWNGAGERIWRPANNPARVNISSFYDENPRGYGLMQRDRNPDHYLDGVRYEDRPSVWVQPLDPWGKGIVQLVEIPTDDEIYDNLIAYWMSSEPAVAGAERSYRYRQFWMNEEPDFPASLARAVAVRVGRGGQPGKDRPWGLRKFVVEFEGPVLEELWGWKVKAEPDISASRGTISRVQLEPVPGTRRWRAMFDLEFHGSDPVDLRIWLKGDNVALSETLLYQYLPNRGY